MSGENPLSGDVEGFAPSHPVDSAAPPTPPKAPKGRMPAAAGETSTELNNAPPATAAPNDSALAPAGEDADNPFVDHAAQTADAQSTAAPSPTDNGDQDNPFVDQPAAPAIPKAPNPAMRNFVTANLQAAEAKKTVTNPGAQVPITAEDPIHDFINGLEAGLQTSVSGLALRGKGPDSILPENADLAMRIGEQISQFAGDAPVMIPAMIAGGMAGGAAGTAVLPIVGTVSGASVGSMAAGFAIPAAIRKMYMDHYERGDITSSREFAARLMSTSWEAIKGATTGAATAITGGAVAPVAGKMAGLGAELVAMTTVGAALEGHLPSIQDFEAGAIVIGGMHAAGHFIPGISGAPKDPNLGVTAKLRNIYAATGETPADIIDQAQRDVILKQQIVAGNMQEPPQGIPRELKPGTDGKPATLEPKDETAMGFGSGGGDGGEPPEPPGSLGELAKEAEARANILGKIGVKAAPEKSSFSEDFRALYAKHVDYLDPLNVAIMEAKDNGAVIPEDKNAYSLGRLAAAHMDKVRTFLEYGLPDPETGKPDGQGLNTILKSTPDGDLDGLRAYGSALRAIELDDRGIQPWSGFDRKEAETFVNANRDKFDEVNKKRIEFSDKMLQWAADNGLLSKDELAAIRKENKDYSPSARVFDIDEVTGEIRSGVSPLKEIKGSDKQILDPLLQTYKNTEMLVKRTVINQVRSTFIDNLEAGGMLSLGREGEDETHAVLRKVQKATLPVEINGEEIKKQLEKQGLSVSFDTFAAEIRKKLPNVTDEQLLDGYEKSGVRDLNPEDMTFFRKRQLPLKDNQIAVIRNGVREVYEGSPGVIDSLKRLDGDKTAIDTTVKIMRGFSNMVRLGVVSNPAFGFAHFFRSQIMSFVYSETGMVPFYHSALSLADFFQKSDTYKQWLYDGGATGSLFKLNETYLKDNKVFEADKKAPFIGKAWNVIKKPFEASEGFIKLTDNLSRFTEYKRSLDQGVSRTEAAMRSRDVVPDYSKIGLQRSALRTGIAFIGAHINSLDRMMQAFKEDPMGTTMKMSALTAVSAMLYAVNKDDEAIEAIPDWQKNTYWNINISRFQKDYKKEDATILRLPKPWAPGILFGSGAEVALDSYFKDRPQEFSHFAQSIAKSVMPELLPNIVQPVMDQYANKNAFTGRPLVPEYKQKLLPELQYEAYTSETAKKIAGLIGYVPLVKDIGPSSDPLASPAVVENYVKGWSGTMGAWALQAADYAGRGFKADTKATPWQDTPFLHSFVSRYPSFSDQRIQDFYENKDATDKIRNSIKAESKAGNFAAAQALMDAHPDYEVQLTGIAKGISTARKAYSSIQEDESIPNVEKRQVLDTILFHIGSMAKEGNQMMSDFRKGLGQNVGKGP